MMTLPLPLPRMLPRLAYVLCSYLPLTIIYRCILAPNGLCNVATNLLPSVIGRLPGEKPSLKDCASRPSPRGVADAAGLLVAGVLLLYRVEEGQGDALARGSGPVAGSKLVSELSLGIWVGGISSERWLLSRWTSRLPERERQGGCGQHPQCEPQGLRSTLRGRHR